MKIYQAIDTSKSNRVYMTAFNREDVEKYIKGASADVVITEHEVYGDLSVFVVSHHSPSGVYSDLEDAKHIASMMHLNWYRLSLKELYGL